MIEKNITFSYQEFSDESFLPQTERDLVKLARKKTNSAYAPYSEFYVGAAVLLENGEIITGNNQENGAYPSGLCAERVAVFAASSMFPGVPMKMIAVSARSTRVKLDDPVSPCGACRQVILEYELLQNKPIKVLLSSEKGRIFVIEKVKDLLPLSFSGDDLKKNPSCCN
jgi:cytidine deaminase